MFTVHIRTYTLHFMYICMPYVRTYTKTSTISLHITTITFSTYVCRHLTHTQHWGAPHTPDDGLDDKVLDGLPNGISVQVQLCPHVLPERKKSPVWRGGGGRGEGTRRDMHKQTIMYIYTYVCSGTCIYTRIQMGIQYISSHVETSYECVHTYVSDAHTMYVCILHQGCIQ